MSTARGNDNTIQSVSQGIGRREEGAVQFGDAIGKGLLRMITLRIIRNAGARPHCRSAFPFLIRKIHPVHGEGLARVRDDNSQA